MPETILAVDMPNAMAAMAKALIDAPLDDALSDCAKVLQEGFVDNFQAARDSDGVAWPARKDPRPTHPLLILSSALLKSVQSDTPDISGRTLQVGVDPASGIPYAAVHQFGYPPRNIAQREYIHATDDVLVACAEIIGDEVAAEVFG